MKSYDLTVPDNIRLNIFNNQIITIPRDDFSVSFLSSLLDKYNLNFNIQSLHLTLLIYTRKLIKNSILIILQILIFASFSFAQTVEPQWEKCYGGTETDEGLGIIKVDSSYWIVGHTNSADGDISYNHGTYDIWLLKMD